jgi:hypothetical protein
MPQNSRNLQLQVVFFTGLHIRLQLHTYNTSPKYPHTAAVHITEPFFNIFIDIL